MRTHESALSLENGQRSIADMIAEVALGKTLEATTLEFGRTVHPHPTISEAIMEAALAADGEAINF